MIIIPYVDAVAAVLFAATFIVALKNHQDTIGLSNYWLMFAAASFMGFLWAGSTAAEWFGILPAFMDQVHPSFSIAAASAFSIASLVALFTEIKTTVA